MASSDLSRDGQRPTVGRRSRVQAPPPEGAALIEQTAELTEHLGSTRPDLRDEHALPLLVAWVSDGAHDRVLAALGDGMTDGLHAGFDGSRSPSREPGDVLRRAASALLLAAAVRRDNAHHLLHPETVLDWAESVFTWIVREHPEHPRTPDPTHTSRSTSPVGHGADALAALADSPHLDRMALTVLLDVIGDRVLLDTRLGPEDLDLLARATTHAFSREQLDTAITDPWIHRIAHAAGHARASTEGSRNATAFVRALHLRVALGSERFPGRADTLLSLADAVRASSPGLFEA